MIRVGYGEGAAAAVFLGGAGHGELGIGFEDVETATEDDGPAVVGDDFAVVGGGEVVLEFDAEGTEIVLERIEDVDHLGDGFVGGGSGVEDDFQLFGGIVGFLQHLDEVDEVIYLICNAYEGVGDFDDVSSAEVVGEEGFVGDAGLVEADFEGFGGELRDIGFTF